MSKVSIATEVSCPGPKGQIIRRRRRQLDLSQKEVARRIKTSPHCRPCRIRKGRPSNETIARLVKVLGLEGRELFFLLHPDAHAFLKPPPPSQACSAWEQFRNDDRFRRFQGFLKERWKCLPAGRRWGEVRSPEDFIYVLNAVRQAIGRGFRWEGT